MGKSEKTVRIGFIGAGSMGQMAHLRNYVNIDECEVVALAEVREATGQLVAERYGIPRVYASHTDMLDNEDLDGVVCSQSFDLHATLLPDIYGRVKYLFTEKPLAVGVDAGTRLAELADAKGTVHMVGYHKRSDPATMYAKETIDEWKREGDMGPLKYVRILMPEGDWIANGFVGMLNAGDAPPPFDREPLVTDFPGAVAGTSFWEWQGLAGQYVRFVNYYIHQVNLMRHLLGEDYQVTYADRSGVLLVVESESGITGTIEMSPYRTTIDWQESALVAFEKGKIDLTLPAPLARNRPGTVSLYADPGDGNVPQRTAPALPWIGAMRQQAVNFVKVCKGELAPLCTAAEAVKDLDAARAYIRLWESVQ